MRAVLDVRYSDVDPAALRWALGLPPQAALATMRLEVDALEVEVRLLGASHQVIVRGAGFTCSETVACGAEGSTGLPGRASRRLPGGAAEYGMVSTNLRFDDPAGVDEYVRALDRRLGERRDALVGMFPAPASAVTAVAVDRTPTGVRWQTWHAYPEVATIVATVADLVVT